MSNTVVTGWTLIVPVKPPRLGKSRIAGAAGTHRAALARAVAADTVAAALACPAVTEVVVVTGDPEAAADLTGLGARIVAEGPPRGLNAALRHGALAVPPGAHRAALQADLPALRPDELACALSDALAFPRAFLADREGVGTVLYTARSDAPFFPAFGGASRARHLALGVTELPRAGRDSVRTDVDTLDDLRAALALGVGPRTESVAALILAGASG
ncbi:2-phospho-L-lactate guanylyltransferase [Actinocorallia sp. API 0066]|uniref:2-phospho-L-lactate guanylyltransferase n=1 Tax=Actinocorallia sp. API 0066 TaxID=2896846 RepID=UPI001E34DBB9|nr:2-phospho-L-lactate guanylyltransferase [Actinocorallia sp. API 0066]MCD0448357.1 2-phospho-L-lactate guanylyltransferase [Actinocorallia sp. API 0066]